MHHEWAKNQKNLKYSTKDTQKTKLGNSVNVASAIPHNQK